ncbi:MAG: tRNA preQ1(34) S-adenosylmethionine ribosyltransferase-isomerase QueA [Nitrospinae bacterium CG11_big_fil_rev_8_21_14_0_20_45_15]|nr:MAG: tRNA preQ1(34) S-adenosylmethionine ribosyltransferase-isomerase QueA [Nitrospinae bacterium CG11_big_fil_rev_8_21_14_0_20_45_15]
MLCFAFLFKHNFLLSLFAIPVCSFYNYLINKVLFTITRFKIPLRLSDFDFELPSELIAQVPPASRNASRLMVVDRQTETVSHHSFNDLPGFLRNSPLMVLNNVKVTPAKFYGFVEKSGREVDVLLTSPVINGTCRALLKGLSKLRAGDVLNFPPGSLKATFLSREGSYAVLKFIESDDLSAELSRLGRMPLPPYIKRGKDDSPALNLLDRERYQTVFAENEGAVAAPTAGLHFTPELLEKLSQNQIDTAYVTLRVGPGTFQSIRTEEITEHIMEKEAFEISTENLGKIRTAKDRQQAILAVGSTSLRTLESINLKDMPQKGGICGRTGIFIYPGHVFKNTDLLLTNFHLPKSTLFLLTCAFGGTRLIKGAYEEAVKMKYRFFSYGDAMMIL